MVRSTLSLTLVLSLARAALNLKSRALSERLWVLELKAESTRRRRIEAVDKLSSLLVYTVAGVFSLQALGLDVNSVLAIGGVGGLAVGLAGREILENLFTGLIILSSNPFEVGEEVLFRPASGQTVEGFVVDVGWYRTTIRSYDRELYTIPNSVFSRTVTLNITRKMQEWRFYEHFGIRVEDLAHLEDIIADMRRILRQANRAPSREALCVVGWGRVKRGGIGSDDLPFDQSRRTHGSSLRPWHGAGACPGGLAVRSTLARPGEPHRTLVPPSPRRRRTRGSCKGCTAASSLSTSPASRRRSTCPFTSRRRAGTFSWAVSGRVGRAGGRCLGCPSVARRSLAGTCYVGGFKPPSTWAQGPDA